MISLINRFERFVNFDVNQSKSDWNPSNTIYDDSAGAGIY